MSFIRFFHQAVSWVLISLLLEVNFQKKNAESRIISKTTRNIKDIKILRASPGPEVKASLSMSWMSSGIFSMESSNHMIGSRKGSSIKFGRDKTGELSTFRFICIRTWTETPRPIVGCMSIRNPWSSSLGSGIPSTASSNFLSAK